MNVIFHFGSAVAAVVLAWALLRAQKQRDALRKLAYALADAGEGPRPVEIAGPAAWLASFAGAVGINIEIADSYDLAPRRIRGWVLFELFLSKAITLIRCLKSQDDLVVEITTARPPPDEAARITIEREAAAALGDGVQVRLLARVATANPQGERA